MKVAPRTAKMGIRSERKGRQKDLPAKQECWRNGGRAREGEVGEGWGRKKRNWQEKGKKGKVQTMGLEKSLLFWGVGEHGREPVNGVHKKQ